MRRRSVGDAAAASEGYESIMVCYVRVSLERGTRVTKGLGLIESSWEDASLGRRGTKGQKEGEAAEEEERDVERRSKSDCRERSR